MRIGLLSSFLCGVLTLFTVLSMLVPAVILCREMLFAAKEEHLVEVTEAVASRVGDYFSLHSAHLTSLRTKFDAVTASDQQQAQLQLFRELFVPSLLHDLRASLAITSVGIVMLEDSHGHNVTTCHVDSLVITPSHVGLSEFDTSVMNITEVGSSNSDTHHPAKVPCSEFSFIITEEFGARNTVNSRKWMESFAMPSPFPSSGNLAVFNLVGGSRVHPHALLFLTVSYQTTELRRILSGGGHVQSSGLSIFLLSPQREILVSSNPSLVGIEESQIAYNDVRLPRTVLVVAATAVESVDVCGSRDGGNVPSVCDFSKLPRELSIDKLLVAYRLIRDIEGISLNFLMCSFYEKSSADSLIADLQVVETTLSGVLVLVMIGVGFLIGTKAAQPIRKISAALCSATVFEDNFEGCEPRGLISKLVTEYQELSGALLKLPAHLREQGTLLPSKATNQYKEVVYEEKPTFSETESASTTTLNWETTPQHRSGIACDSVVTKQKLSCKHVSIMQIQTREWYSGFYGQTGNRQLSQSLSPTIAASCSEYLTVIVQCIGKGSIEYFNGDTVLVTWNTSTIIRPHHEEAMHSAVAIKDAFATISSIFLFDRPMGVGVCTGRAYCGVCGNESLKAFHVFGRPLSDAQMLSKTAANLSTRGKQPILLTDSKKLLSASLFFVGLIDNSLQAWEILALGSRDPSDMGEGVVPQYINTSLMEYCQGQISFNSLGAVLTKLDSIGQLFPESHTFALAEASQSEELFQKALTL